MENTIGIIQARMGSKRFPNKMMAHLGGSPLIEWIIKRVKRSKELNKVVLATSVADENNTLVSVAERFGIELFRGNEKDVFSRFVGAVTRFDADLVVRICGDNPFVDPNEIDRLILFFKKYRPDYAFNHITKLGNGYADGFGAEILSGRTLKELDQYPLTASHREHVTSFIWDHRHAFEIKPVPAPGGNVFSKLRFDIDRPSDLEALQDLAAKCGMDGTMEQYVSMR